MLAEGERSQQYGLHYTLISGHPSSCPLCVPWQGAVLIDDVFSDGKPDGKTPLLSQAINDGLYHYNCRHTRTVFIPGIDNAKLFDKDIASPEETAKRYAIEQQQRYNERKIREWKRREAASLGNKEQSLARVKILEWQAQQRTLRDIAEKKGIPFYRQYSREQIGGDTKPAINQTLTKKKGLDTIKETNKIAVATLKQYYGESKAEQAKELLTKAPQGVQEVWNKYESKIIFDNTNHKGRAFYSNRTKGISLNLSQDAIGEKAVWKGAVVDISKPFETTFHEIGHLIDSRAGEGTGAYGKISTTFKSEKFVRTYDQYDRDGSKETIVDGYTLNQMISEEIKDHMKNTADRIKDEIGVRPRKNELHYEISKELRDIPPILGTSISDIYEGATKEAVTGTSGHGKAYWKTTPPSTEAFAHFFSAEISNQGKMDTIKKYIPKSVEIFEEIMNKIKEM